MPPRTSVCPHSPVLFPLQFGVNPPKFGVGMWLPWQQPGTPGCAEPPPPQLQSHSPGETTDIVGGAEGSLYPLSHGTLPANPPAEGGNAFRSEALPPPRGVSSGAGSVARGGGGVFYLPLRSAVGAARPGRLPVASRAGAEDAPWGPAARAGARRGLRGG